MIKKLRAILRKPFDDSIDKFKLLKEVSEVIAVDRSAGQEFVLRILARREEFMAYNDIVISLVKQVGLFPYLGNDELTIRDAFAYEMHRPEGMDNVVFHSSQAEVYYHLISGKNVILSAPTSYGKSLIVDSIIAHNKHNNIVIIVPSIALIDETRKRISRFKEQYKIITYPHQEIKERNIFILTQERAVDIIDDVKIDFFVIDEFYKLGTGADGNDRYQILNKVFYKLVKSGAQFYLLGPNIETIDTGTLSNIQYEFIRTDYKTVVSERHIIKAKANERIEELLNILEEHKDPTLIYCRSPKSANFLAKQLLDSGLFNTVAENIELAHWIKENYHYDWILAIGIENGIGIHHGKIPRALSQQCVKLFNEGKLRCLVCTSTLIEGVNTKAKNVIVYDHKIATADLDFFTFNNICGRSGRMFSHFIGNIFMFKEPPQPELPLVDFPIFTQTEDVPDTMLINVDKEDLSDNSIAKIRKYIEQDLLSLQTLRNNSFINLDYQLALADYINNRAEKAHHALFWNKIPTALQLKVVCVVIWDFLVKSNKRIYGVSSGAQLAYRINSYREARNIKNFIISNIEDGKDINEAIELSLDIQRHWINFQFPRYLRSLCQIANDVFKRHNLPLCDYNYFATLVESYFCPVFVVPFDEYGLPIQISTKIGKEIKLSNELDIAIQQLKQYDVERSKLANIEKYFVRNVQKYL